MFRSDIPNFSDITANINVLYNTSENFSWELVFSTAVFSIPHDGDSVLSEKFTNYSIALGMRLQYSITDKLGLILTILAIIIELASTHSSKSCVSI